MSVKTYDLKKVTAIFGPVILSGFGESDAISITPEANIYDAKKGCDGQTTRCRTNNDDYKCELTFMATADARSKVQDLALRNAALSTLTYPFKLNSPATGEEITCSNAWIEKNPDITINGEPGERKYTLYLPDCTVSTKEVLASILGFLG